MKRFVVKAGYVFVHLLGLFLLFIPLRLARRAGRIEEINLGDPDIWTTGGNLLVTNHPSWLDQFLIICLRLPYWGTSFLPYIVAAEDSIERLFYLKLFKKLSFLVSVNRKGNRRVLRGDVERMMDILKSGNNLMVAGAAGRDFKGEEIIFSPQKHKPLRKFTNLSGMLAILPGVKTTVICIDGTGQLYKVVVVNGEKKAKLLLWNFLVLFLLKGKIKVRIIYSSKSVMEGKKSSEATEIIQQTALDLLDHSP